MKPTLQPGLTYQHLFDLPASKTVPALYPEATEFQAMPGVFATGYMVGLLEWAAVELLAPHLEEGEGSLGISVNFSHTAATLPGQRITVDVKCTSVEGRKIGFEITAHDGIDRITTGTHERMIVRWDRFAQKLNEKAKQAGVAPLAER